MSISVQLKFLMQMKVYLAEVWPLALMILLAENTDLPPSQSQQLDCGIQDFAEAVAEL